jgi:uncharacterized damage-inducible protein DinB
MSWAPGEGMRSIAGQLLEIAGSEYQVVTIMKVGRYIPDEEVREIVGDYKSLDRLAEFLKVVRRETLGLLHGFSSEELEAEIQIDRWYESSGLRSVPRSEVFRGIAQHEAYHTGQLVSYLWAKGDNPYEW